MYHDFAKPTVLICVTVITSLRNLTGPDVRSSAAGPAVTSAVVVVAASLLD